MKIVPGQLASFILAAASLLPATGYSTYLVEESRYTTDMSTEISLSDSNGVVVVSDSATDSTTETLTGLLGAAGLHAYAPDGYIRDGDYGVTSQYISLGQNITWADEASYQSDIIIDGTHLYQGYCYSYRDGCLPGANRGQAIMTAMGSAEHDITILEESNVVIQLSWHPTQSGGSASSIIERILSLELKDSNGNVLFSAPPSNTNTIGNQITFNQVLAAGTYTVGYTLEIALQTNSIIDAIYPWNESYQLTDYVLFSFFHTPPIITLPPTADAGMNQSVHIGDQVQLDGSGSYDDVTATQDLDYHWQILSRPEGSLTVLDQNGIINPTFTADVAGDYLIQLKVIDEERQLSGPSTVIVSSLITQPPTADAGTNQSVHIGDQVQLDGSGSFDDVTATQDLLYRWQILSRPESSLAVFDQSSLINPIFTADVTGDYLIQLKVIDEDGQLSEPSTIIVSSLNTPPNSSAGLDIASYVGDVVTLDGTGSSDPDGDPLTYSWTLISSPEGGTNVFVDTSTAHPILVPDRAGSYVVELVVNDGLANSLPDSVEVIVISKEAAIEKIIMNVMNTVNTLDVSSFTTSGNQQALSNYLKQAIRSIQDGAIVHAKEKLDQAIEHTDGCALRGAADQSGDGYEQDYTINCEDQAVIYPLLIEVLNLL